MMSKLTNEKLKNLPTHRILALYKSKKASLRKAQSHYDNEEAAELETYCNQIKYILDKRENVEKNNG